MSAAKTPSSTAAEGHLRVTQVRSGISTKPKHRATLRALGLRGVGRSRVLPDRPEVRGMVARVPHLVTVEGADETEAAEQRERSASARSGPARLGGLGARRSIGASRQEGARRADKETS